jgi:phenylalanyl-tRNA synthetase alpha chain
MGKGCPACSGTGWSMELLGCGMTHPNVLRNCGIDPEIYSGYAFGMGIDRVAMVKYGIPNIRLLFENDVRFLKQF